MSISLLQRVRSFLDTEGLITGYNVRYYQWYDDDETNQLPLLVFMMADSSGMDTDVVQSPEVRVVVLFDETDIQAQSTNTYDMLRAFRGADKTTGVIRFEPVGTMRGPYTTEAGKKIFELIIRCYTEDQ